MKRDRIVTAVLIILTIFSLGYAYLYGNEKYNIKCSEYLINASKDTLINQIGIKETGNNGGAVLKYQKIFGLRNQPYCAMGQYWCYYVSAVKKTDVPFPRSANAQSYFNYAKRAGTSAPYIPEVNDFVVWRVDKKVTGHIERIIEIRNFGYVITVGFNTSSGRGSQRDGGGVYKRLRHIYNPLGILLIKGIVGVKP